MKKILVLLVLLPLLMCGIMAQTVHYVEEATITWNVVTEMMNDTPVVGVVEYELYRTPSPVVDGQNATAHTLEGVVSSPSLHVYIPNDSTTYAYGVRTKLTTDGGATILYSAINWSDVNGLSTPDPFLYRHPQTVSPKAPQGLSGN